MAKTYELKPIPNGNLGDKVSKKNEPTNVSDKYSYKIGITFMLVLIWICNGMANAMRGTTLPDQRDRLGATMQQMGIMNSVTLFTSVGGVLINGVLFDFLISKTFMLVGIYLITSASMLMLCRFVLSYPIFFAMEAVQKFTISGCDCIGHIVVLRLWGDKASSPMFIVHMGWYIGGALGPFVAKPFLSPEIHYSSSTSMTVEPTVEPGRYPDGSHIHIAYLVPGCIFLLSGVGFLIAYFMLPPLRNTEKEEKRDEQNLLKSLLKLFNPRTCAHDSVVLSVFLLISFFMFYFFYKATGIPTSNYLYTYATEGGLEFSKQDAATLDGVYYFCGFAGRLAFAVISLCVPIQVSLLGNVFLQAANGIGLAIWGKDDPLGFVICCLIDSFCGSTLWPACATWTDQYIYLTGTAFFLAPFANSVSGLVFDPIYASYYDAGNPGVTFYGVALFGFIMFIIVVIGQIAVLKQGSRFTKVESVEIVKYEPGVTNDFPSCDTKLGHKIK